MSGTRPGAAGDLNPVDGIYSVMHTQPMDLIRIYECLCDETRLRMLNLLTRGPLCVCHLQELLDQPQVKISKHLAYLKGRGVVEVRRHQNWMPTVSRNPAACRV